MESCVVKKDAETFWQWKYVRLQREKQAKRDPASEERAEEACRLSAESEHISKNNAKTALEKIKNRFEGNQSSVLVDLL
ncbi:hypothetical protein [Alkalihalobacillus sp. TS-13]|uniref:hypothetical protein n=1 Tax=Alkalihalobacillus sp. TS-13 TaxID=2842455 RepID=UPI001C869D27|nr:hypothetical protein [Alkalihalobacillus sp. TS-13]